MTVRPIRQPQTDSHSRTSPQRQIPWHSGRYGFTLLEVVLTLSMAVVLMSLVGAALQFYAGSMNVRDLDVRRVQLAAAVLQMVSDDLRAATYPQEFDASALENFLAGAVGGGGGDSVSSAASEVLGIGDGNPGTLESPGLESESIDLMASTMTLMRPGMIGNETEIQFDISRLPRLEQWQPILGDSPAEVADVPSDLKTVTYYVQPPGAVGGVSDPLREYLPQDSDGAAATGQTPGGLVRRELDRAANKWAVETGGISRLLTTGDLLAEEVIAIEFSYFDGVNWQPFWNSDQMQALPLAVQVKLTIGEPASADGEPTAATTAEPRTFTQIIQLPAGRAVPLQSTPMGAMP